MFGLRPKKSCGKLTIPNPEHLFEQAERLITDRPRQVDLRRAISTAYYAVFHAIVAAAADQTVGRRARGSAQHALAYRSVNHNGLRNLCNAVWQTPVSPKYRPYAPEGFGPDIAAFAKAVVELQVRREAADYDPLQRFARADARFAVNSGRSALRRFQAAQVPLREAFLFLLFFQPRA